MTILYQNNQTEAAHEISRMTAKAVWNTVRSGSPGNLSLTLIEDPDVTGEVALSLGGILAVREEGQGLFYGYIFKISKDEKGETSVTAYDQLRYLKNKDTYVFSAKRADEITRQVCADFGIKTGALANTGYVIPSMVEDGKSLFDILLKALDLTLIHTQKLYYLWDDFGSLRVSEARERVLGLVLGDASLVTGYQYQQDIDGDTANQIKLVRDNKESGKRDVYIVRDSSKMALWGTLQYYEKLQGENITAAQAGEKAEQLLELYGRPARSLTLDALADLSVRAGVSVLFEVAELGLRQYFIVEECSQDLVNETMRLKLKVV